MTTRPDWLRVFQMFGASLIIGNLYGWRLGCAALIILNILAPDRVERS